MAMNFEQARQNMVENQVRPWEVLDARVLDVLSRVRREDFVAPAHRQLAFADLCLPLGHGEVMMKPVVEGRVLQALELMPADHVLEIGTGSGFLTACMAKLSAQVTSVDIHADFTVAATQRLQATGISNVTADHRRSGQRLAAGRLVRRAGCHGRRVPKFRPLADLAQARRPLRCRSRRVAGAAGYAC